MIEAFRVGATARGRTLWEGITFAAGSGEVWFVTGPPSCGKTLLLRILRGEMRPAFGDVLVAGESLYGGSPEHNRKFRAAAGVVPESFPGERNRTVEEMFRLAALAAGRVLAAERRERTGQLLSLVGLPGSEAEPVSSLSGSERTRAALAVELFRSPRYLFLDMLFANAGTEWTNRLVALFRALAKEERTIILTERQLPERWPGAKAPPSLSAGPFHFYRYRLGSPLPAKKSAVGNPPAQGGPSPETTGGGE